MVRLLHIHGYLTLTADHPVSFPHDTPEETPKMSMPTLVSRRRSIRASLETIVTSHLVYPEARVKPLAGWAAQLITHSRMLRREDETILFHRHPGMSNTLNLHITTFIVMPSAFSTNGQ